MTDNKTIVDGVDVSGCSWCDFEPNTEPYCRINDGEDLNCEELPNCYYKQLKRAEQECEELEEKLKRQKDYTVTYKSYIYEEEKQLKKQRQAKEQECEELKSENFTFEELVKTQENLIDKYKQALDEIDKQIKLLSNRVPLFEIEQIAKDLIKIQDIINKVKEQQ